MKVKGDRVSRRWKWEGNNIPGMLGDIIENQAPTRVALKM